MNSQETSDPNEQPSNYGPERVLSYSTQNSLFKVLRYLSAALITVVMGLPIYWMAQTSFRTKSSIQSGEIMLFPTGAKFTLERYEVLLNPTISTYIINSAIITLGTVIAVVLISTVAGYGLAKFNYKYKIGFARLLLTGYMFSAIVIGLPIFLIWKQLGLVNTRIGLIIVLTARSLPFTVWVMWKYIQTIPHSLEESAWIVGAPRWRGFVDIVLPQCGPGIIAVALFAFAIGWGDFTFGQILLPSPEAQTFPVGILRIINQGFATAWGDLLAASFFMTIPPLLFAWFLQSYLLKGFALR